jgi:hypothetical protein
MRARHTIILAFLSIVVLAIAGLSPAWAQGDPRVEARTHYMSGKQKFDAGDFRGAIAEFSAADNLAPSAVNDFNIALAYERLDDAPQAVRYYRSYLDRMPSATNRAEVEAALQRLDAAAKTKADADRAEQARIAEEQRKADEARRLAEQQNGGGGGGPGGGGGGPGGGGGGAIGPAGGGAQKTTYAPTGDPELDRVAAVDLAVMRGASPLPPPTGGGGGGGGAAAGGGAAGGAGVPPPNGGGGEPPVKKSKPFYKSPVFWVVAAVGLYVLIVLAQDDTSSQPLMMPLPDGPANVPGGGGGATLFRF